MNSNISILFADIRHNAELKQCGCSLPWNLDEVMPNLKFDVMCRTKSLLVGEINMDFTDGHRIAEVYVAGIRWFSGATGKVIIFMALFERSV